MFQHAGVTSEAYKQCFSRFKSRSKDLRYTCLKSADVNSDKISTDDKGHIIIINIVIYIHVKAVSVHLNNDIFKICCEVVLALNQQAILSQVQL